MTPGLTDLLRDYWWLVPATFAGTMAIVSGLAASAMLWIQDTISIIRLPSGAGIRTGTGAIGPSVDGGALAVRSHDGASRTRSRARGS